MTRGHMPLEVSMQIDDTSLVTQKVVKYLGIQLDCRLTYWAQIRHAATKADQSKVTGVLNGKADGTLNRVADGRRNLFYQLTNRSKGTSEK